MRYKPVCMRSRRAPEWDPMPAHTGMESGNWLRLRKWNIWCLVLLG